MTGKGLQQRGRVRSPTPPRAHFEGSFSVLLCGHVSRRLETARPQAPLSGACGASSCRDQQGRRDPLTSARAPFRFQIIRGPTTGQILSDAKMQEGGRDVRACQSCH